jgi:hypothetical protein
MTDPKKFNLMALLLQVNALAGFNAAKSTCRTGTTEYFEKCIIALTLHFCLLRASTNQKINMRRFMKKSYAMFIQH